MTSRRSLVLTLLACPALAVASVASVEADVRRCEAPLPADERSEACSRVIAAPAGRYTAWAYFSRGVIRDRKGDLKGAIEDFDAAVRLDAQNPNPLAARGTAHLKLGDLERALADLNGALALQPDHPQALHNRGELLGRKGDHQAAIADFDAVLRRDPRSIPVLMSRAHARHDIRDLDGTMADFDAVLALAPDNLGARAGRAGVEAEKARIVAARDGGSWPWEAALAVGVLVLVAGPPLLKRLRKPRAP